jgi:thioredoxin 1
MMTRATTALLLVTFLLAGCGQRATEQKKGMQRTSAGLTVLTDSTFARAVSADSITLVDFGGKFCRPCKEMKKILTQFMQQHPDIPVYLVYSEDSPDLLEKWGVQMIPTQVVFDAEGRELTRHVGVWTLTQMNEALRKLHLLS